MTAIKKVLSRKYYRFLSSVMVLVVAFTAVLPNIALAENDWLNHWFWVNNDTKSSQDFQLVIYPGSTSNGTGNFVDYVCGWMGADPDTGTSIDFVQVGIIADGIGVRWFAFTEATASCFSSGTSAWGGKGCIGAYNDHVAVGMWTRVELVNYGQGFWIARVWDQNNHPVDVAKLYIPTGTVKRVYATSEQAYASSPDLQLDMSFWYYNPQYMKWGTGFMDWPAHTGDYQNWYDQQTSVPGKQLCPNYGLQLQSNPRFWFNGKTNGPHTCFTGATF